MPVARSTGQRIAAGTISASSLTSAYAITALPVQSDQSFDTPWILSARISTTPTPARVTTTGDLSRDPDGLTAWRIGFSYMSFGMTSYWNDTFIPGGAWWAYITIMDYDENNQPVFYQGKIWKPNYPSDKALYVTGGWASVVYDIEAATQIFP